MQKTMLDILHRGYLAYLAATEGSEECDKMRRTILRADKTGEFSDTALCTCEVKTDWIERIEASLPYIERAVHENRQFILRQGETVPIEKVRRVSKTSVEHLARHSELITREPEPGNDIIPEKIFMTENVGTYAVYENRFLYMLLCYIKDFSEIKYTKISAFSNSFSSELVFDKKIASKAKKINFTLKYTEESNDSVPTEQSEQTEQCLLRIKSILASVDTLLKTGLMIEVSSAPLLKPPIARTNVLLQNPCFSAAMELYDYLSAYTDDGYTRKDIYRHHGELTEQARADLAELIAITSYFSHKNGGLLKELEERYRKEEAARIEMKRKARDERLAALKEIIGEPDKPTAEYLLTLEDRCKDAESRITELSKNTDLISAAEKKIAETEAKCASLRQEADEAKNKQRILEENERRNSETYQREMQSMDFRIKQKDDEIKKMIDNHQAELKMQSEQFHAEYAELAEKYHLLSARLHAKQAKNGGADEDEDFSSKEAFAELEAEYKAFERFFKSQWKSAKRKIRRNQLWKK